MWRWIFCFYFFSRVCSGVIHNLNESEYDLMPPLFALDEYGRCLRTGGTYCMVKLTLYADPPHQLFTMIQEYSNFRTKHYNHSLINRGVCVTKTCEKYINNKNISGTTAELEGLLEACLNESIFKEYGLQAKVRELSYCDRQDDRKEIDVYQIVVAVIIVAILVMNVVGSLYDIFFHKHIGVKNSYAGNIYLLSFSFRRNWELLVTPEHETSTLHPLRFLNGLRVLLMFLTIVGHTYLMSSSHHIDNPQDLEKYYDKPMFRLMITGISIVQVFFMMSTILLGYRLLLEEKHAPNTIRKLPKILMNRWMRLSPMYALCLAFSATWLDYLGSGPLWGTLRTTVVSACRRYWWLHLIYLNNYVPDDAYCMPHTWYLAADTQLFVLAAVVMLGLRRWRVKALLVLLAVGLASSALTVWRYDLDGRFLVGPEVYRTMRDSTQTLELMYKPAHTNMVISIIGLLASMLSYRLKKSGLKINEYKFLTTYYALLVPAVIALFLTGARYYDLPMPAPLAERGAYAALLPATLGALLTVGMVGSVLGYEAGLCSYFQWRGWTVPSRLSYGVYLVHFMLLHVLAASQTGLQHASPLLGMIYVFGVYGVSTGISLVLYLTVEAPFCTMHKAYLRRTESIKSCKGA